MKTKLILLLFVFAYLHVNAQCTTNVVIPDANFKTSLLNDHTIDTNSDGEISCDEATAFTGDMNVSNKSITDLTGIEAFTSLTKLTCFNNSIASLDISKNTALAYLNCFNNSLTSLDVTQNTALTYLSFSNNSVTSIDVSQNAVLETLSFSSNSITSIDVSNNPALESFTCHSNELTTIDVSNNPALNVLTAYNTGITSIDVSNNPLLTKLDVDENGLTSLDVSNNPLLKYLYFEDNSITSIDVSNNPALYYLYCTNNQLTDLDVSQNIALYSLKCGSNSLTSLDVSLNTELGNLNCTSNSLTSLNIANGNNIELYLYATDNPDLACIQIDEGHTYFGDWEKDETAEYSTVDCNTLSVVDENFNNTIRVFPNPIINTLHINLSTEQEFKKAQIFNMLGKEVLTTSATTIDMSSFSSGIYLLKIENTDNNVVLRKIIKE
ncbi:leucine-rich repeat domain-containing protein [Polaribacter sp.]|uniref:leucine-rich repeat domain-containing protein n=1 Tax=Polaribacter sp. TaxID=1920175 RepID=UPI0032994C5D